MALNFTNPGSLMSYNNMLAMGGMGQPMNMAQAAAVMEAQKEQKRQEQVRQVLPALLSQIDTADVNASLAKLIQAGVDEKNAIAIVEMKLKMDAQKQQSAALASIMGEGPPQATGGYGSPDSPLSVRNNNPGNMKDPATGSFRRFDTAGLGAQAMRDDLLGKVTGKSKVMQSKFGEGYQPTLRNVISTWAPPTENNTDAYVNFVATKAGISPDQTLTPEDVDKIIPHMIQMEGGQKATEHFSQRQPVQQPTQGGPDPDRLARYSLVTGDRNAMDYAQFEQTRRTNEENKKSDLTKAKFTQEREFYNDFSKQTEQYSAVRDAVQNMQTAAQDDSGAGDIQMIFAFMKAQDPGSTVREGEFATAEQAGGVPARVVNLYNKLLTGERLTPEQRKQFLRLGEANFVKAKKQHDRVKERFSKRATAYDLDPSRVTFDLELEANPTAPAKPTGWSIRRVR